jgi:hypothetical protein
MLLLTIVMIASGASLLVRAIGVNLECYGIDGT